MADPGYDPRSFTEDRVFDAPGILGWLTCRRKDTLLRMLHEQLGGRTAARVLDVGCGYGDMLVETRATVRVGVDLNLHALRTAAARAPQLRLAIAMVEHLPFATGAFDMVICSEVLEHLERPEMLAHEIDRVTRPGGMYCITVPNEAITTFGRFILGKRPAKSPAHKQTFTPRSVAALFPRPPISHRLTPFERLPFSLATNVVALFTKP